MSENNCTSLERDNYEDILTYFSRLTASHGQWLQGGAVKTPFAWTSQERRDGYRAFENALEMLNDNHQLCLR